MRSATDCHGFPAESALQQRRRGTPARRDGRRAPSESDSVKKLDARKIPWKPRRAKATPTTKKMQITTECRDFLVANALNGGVRDAGEEETSAPSRAKAAVEARRTQDPLEAEANEGDADDELDANHDRPSRFSRRERAQGPLRRDVVEERPAAPPERKRSAEETRRTPSPSEAEAYDRDDDDNKLEAISDRLSQLSSRERARGADQRNGGEKTSASAPNA